MRELLLCALMFAVPAFAQEDDYEPEPEVEVDDLPAQDAAPADDRFERLMMKNAPSAPQSAVQTDFSGMDVSGSGMTPEVVVPLIEWESTRRAIERLRESRARPSGPAVVLGAAEYRAVATGGALSVKVRLDVTLGAPGQYKTVPVIGADVVLVSATRGGKPVPVTVMDGYHVWTTREVGEASVELEVLVPARGPRGSLEFELSVPRTPVTAFSCRFPSIGLEPRVDGAVSESLSVSGGSTELTATLPPTTRIRLVGFKDLGEAESRETKVYAETSTLLSIAPAHADVFSVIRYTILYGRTRSFVVALPPGVTVVAADGEGAFRWAVERAEDGRDVLRGETAFPIRGAYEISLRLRRELGASPVSFDAPIPRTLGVEREHGWLAIEVPGRLRLEDKSREEIVPIDVRQLPVEMVSSAVTPILRAYRFHSPKAKVALEITRLPEKEPASAAIDHIRAHTVVSPEGQALTELSITLKNRLRPALLLTLPEGAQLRSTALDGQPVKPTQSAEGQIMLPLRRSAGGERPEPFTLEVVFESKVSPLGWIGAPTLALPAADLPVSSLAWTVEVPGRNVYSRLEGEVAAETFAGEARWHRPVMRHGRLGQADAPDSGSTETSGAMPVRVKLPDGGGVRLEYGRYWLPEGRPMTVSFSYVRRALVGPTGLLGAAALAALVLAATRRLRDRQRSREGAALGAIAIAIGVGVAWVSSASLAIAAVIAGIALASLPAPRALLEGVSTWWTTLPERWRGRVRGEATPWWRLLGRLALGGAIAIASMTTFGAIVAFLNLLSRPF